MVVLETISQCQSTVVIEPTKKNERGKDKMNISSDVCTTSIYIHSLGQLFKSRLAQPRVN